MTLFPQDVQPPSGSRYTCALRRVLWKHMTPFLTMHTGLFTFAFSSWSQIDSAGAESLCYRHVHTLPRKTLFHISCAALHSSSHVHVRREHWEPFYDFFPRLVTLLLQIRHNNFQPSTFRFFAHQCLHIELLPNTLCKQVYSFCNYEAKRHSPTCFGMQPNHGGCLLCCYTGYLGIFSSFLV